MTHSNHGVYTGGQRVKKSPYNKTPPEQIQRAKTHIESFPTVESHYTRKDSKRLYLQPDLNIRKMFQLHKEECSKQGQSHVSEKTYRSIFSENYNLSFHHPKKDQCVHCTVTANKEKNGTLTDAERESHRSHLKRRESARAEKDRDKERVKKDPSTHVITMDLQAVLQAPCGLVSQLYYKRKLSVYNFTTYSLEDGKGTCFTWNETEGKRGACEIGTCISLYLSALPSTVKDVVLFSDCCSGQNRNQYLATALMQVLKMKPTLQKITQKYLETGHTQMEADSMHSAISFAKKSTPISVPSEWDVVLRGARRGKPYKVVPLKHGDMIDFKKIASSRVKNTKTDISGQRVQWLNMKCIEFRQGKEEVMYFKYSFEEEEFHVLRLVGSSGKRGHAVHQSTTLPRLHKEKLPISEAKKKDLLSLCQSMVIDKDFHPFYEALPTSTSATDILPEPDVQDTDDTMSD